VASGFVSWPTFATWKKPSRFLLPIADFFPPTCPLPRGSLMCATWKASTPCVNHKINIRRHRHRRPDHRPSIDNYYSSLHRHAAALEPAHCILCSSFICVYPFVGVAAKIRSISTSSVEDFECTNNCHAMSRITDRRFGREQLALLLEPRSSKTNRCCFYYWLAGNCVFDV